VEIHYKVIDGQPRLKVAGRRGGVSGTEVGENEGMEELGNQRKEGPRPACKGFYIGFRGKKNVPTKKVI